MKKAKLTRRLLNWGVGVTAILWPLRTDPSMQSEILITLFCKVLVHLEIVGC